MRRKQILLAVAYVAVPVLLAWIGYYVYVFAPTHGSRAPVTAGTTSYYDLPTLAVAGSTGTGHSGTMKVGISLEVNQKDLERLPDYEPRIIQKIVIRIHKTSYEDIKDYAGLRRLREDLEHEIADGAFPLSIVSVAIRQIVFE